MNTIAWMFKTLKFASSNVPQQMLDLMNSGHCKEAVLLLRSLPEDKQGETAGQMAALYQGNEEKYNAINWADYRKWQQSTNLDWKEIERQPAPKPSKNVIKMPFNNFRR